MLRHLNPVDKPSASNAPVRPLCRDCRQQAGDEGFTLIELLAVIAIMVVIMGPLAMALTGSIRATDHATDSLTASRARQTLASVFNGDVASVNATGVGVTANAPPAAANTDPTCRPAGATGVPAAAHHVVSFTATRIDPTTSTIRHRRASYWVATTGGSMSLLRSVCNDLSSVVSRNTNGQTRVLLDTLGVGNPEDVVFGAVNGAVDTDVCNEFSCALEVDGRFGYVVTAQRRVFGAGVPVEVGRLYSTSGSNAPPATNNINYPMFDANGLQVGVEQNWSTATSESPVAGNRLSLARGLEGPDTMNVEFRIQQVTSCRFYDPAGNDPSTGKFSVAQPAGPGPGVCAAPGDNDYWFGAGASGWVQWNGASTGQFWYVNMPISAITRGGEYRVWTRLTPVGGDVKQYGGATGYPLWFDWRPQDVVWVSNATSGPYVGNNANNGLTPERPVATIAEGLRRTQTNGAGFVPRPQVMVISGNEHPYMNLTGANVPNNRVLTGGIDAVTLKRPVPQNFGSSYPSGTEGYSGTTTVRGSATSGLTNTAIVVNNKQGLTFRHFYVEAGPLNAGHKSSYGMRVINNATVTLERSFVRSRHGVNGTNGANGADGLNACWGRNGQGNNTGRNEVWEAAPASYGARDTSCNVTANPERRGGYGGPGGSGGTFGGGSGGGPGERGGNNNGGTGGNGGGRGCTGGDDGSPGSAMTGASSNTGGAGRGDQTSLEVWLGGDGASGSNGAPGFGGGGGGGGGGQSCVNVNGNSGGAGGQGGLGGGGGTGGTHGGSSFAVYVHGGSASAALGVGSRAQSGNAGNGGNGGWGGFGGIGGRGGQARAIIGDGGGESAGGGGGAGGSGGAAGAGGDAGWSIAVYSTSASGAVVASGVDLFKGSGGTTGVRGAIRDHPGNSALGIPPAAANSGNGGPGGAGGPAASASWSIFGWTFYAVSGDAGAGGGPGRRADESLDGRSTRSCLSYLGTTGVGC